MLRSFALPLASRKRGCPFIFSDLLASVGHTPRANNNLGRNVSNSIAKSLASTPGAVVYHGRARCVKCRRKFARGGTAQGCVQRPGQVKCIACGSDPCSFLPLESENRDVLVPLRILRTKIDGWGSRPGGDLVRDELAPHVSDLLRYFNLHDLYAGAEARALNVSFDGGARVGEAGARVPNVENSILFADDSPPPSPSPQSAAGPSNRA